jgi:hypothetical protein
MGHKDKIKPAAGLGATSGNVEGRLLSVRKLDRPKNPCPDNCGKLTKCPINHKPCSVLETCGTNTTPCQLIDL